MEPSGEQLEALLPAMAERNARLAAIGQSAMVADELAAARLYTGPMFMLYNVICRGSLREAPQFMRDEFERLCRQLGYGNRGARTRWGVAAK